MEIDHLLFGTAIAFGFYMAWNIGANDVANAMGTSVGSKVLTLKKAIIVAAVLEFCGAFFLGSHVTDTVRKGMFEPMLFEDNYYELIYGMLAALIAAGAWLQIATFFGWPVSTTHSIVGAVVGFVIVAKGGHAVDWGKIAEIVASWGISPLLSGMLSFLIFMFVRQKIFFAADPFKAARKFAPLLIFLVFLVLSLVMIMKGMKNRLSLPLDQALLLSAAIGAVASFIGTIYIKRFLKFKHTEDAESEELGDEDEIKQVLQQVTGVLPMITGNGNDEMIKDRVSKIETEVKKLLGDLKEGALSSALRAKRQISYRNTEKIFARLQILSACMVAFAHGSNDVANAIGPIAAVVTMIQEKGISTHAAVPDWILALGGVGIVIGLATWGYRVIYTIGEKITELSPSRGFSAEFGAALTIVIASIQGLPISTTHTLVGAVLGVGFAQGVNSLNLRVIPRDIISSWFITLPVSGLLAIGFYFILRAVFS